MEMSFLNMVFSFVPNPVDPTRVIIGMKFRAWKLCIKFYGFNKLSGDIEVFTVVFLILPKIKDLLNPDDVLSCSLVILCTFSVFLRMFVRLCVVFRHVCRISVCKLFGVEDVFFEQKGTTQTV